MNAGMVARPLELSAVATFLDSARTQASALLIEGDAGIGKTTLWLEAVQQARERGFRVLATRAGAAEVTLTFAALADLLSEVEETVLDELPSMQRRAVDRVLSRTDEGPAIGEHVLGAAVLSVLKSLAVDAPVLVAIDDLQWLDASSRVVVAFAIRRLTGGVGVLGTVRTGTGTGAAHHDAGTWIQLSRPDGVHRIEVKPLALGGIHKLIVERLGRSLARPTLVKIAELSGGNPFYALELARASDLESSSSDVNLSPTLNSLVHSRIGLLDAEVRDALLAAAATAEPTVELLAHVCDVSTDRVVELLEDVENKGIVTITGGRLRFTHPLLATGVYTGATPSRRRTMHGKLATVVEQPELKARHLALAATSADSATVAALDAAADAAVARGAPLAAAELIDLAIALGADKPVRRIRAAELLFRAGAIDSARSRLEPLIDELRPGTLRSIALTLLGAVCVYGDSFEHAVKVLTTALSDTADKPALRLQALQLLTPAMGLTGHLKESVDYAREAVACADELNVPALRSHALTMWVNVSFMYGLGVDQRSLDTAIELEDPDSGAHVTYRARAIDAVICSWTGRLEEAERKFAALRQQCEERGAEIEMNWVAHYATLNDIWLGRYREAARAADETMQRAVQIGGHQVVVIASMLQSLVAAFAGREEDARRTAGRAIDDARRGGGDFLAIAPTMSLGFLEVSLGNHSAALTVLQPLLADFDPVHSTEIMVGGYLPDAVEALIAVGRSTDAEPLIAALEDNGARLDRPWMLAVGARCRALWSSARGDLDSAVATAERAMVAHQRLPMPFERARTQLLLGQLQRRQRQKDVAAATLAEALAAFDELGTPLWAERARAELARVKVTRQGAGLTPSEQQVAELAAAGMTNTDIGAALFISPKTVEVNLTRTYRKLGIRSRAQLANSLNTPTEAAQE